MRGCMHVLRHLDTRHYTRGDAGVVTACGVAHHHHTLQVAQKIMQHTQSAQPLLSEQSMHVRGIGIARVLTKLEIWLHTE